MEQSETLDKCISRGFTDSSRFILLQSVPPASLGFPNAALVQRWTFLSRISFPPPDPRNRASAGLGMDLFVAQHLEDH